MNIFDLSQKTRIPMKSLRKLEKLGVLIVDREPDIISEIAFHMRTNWQLSLPMLMHFVDQPELLDDLGYVSARYRQRAETQIEALGDLSQHLAPLKVTSAIDGAARNESEAIAILETWLKDVLPCDPVSYYWICVRLLKPQNEFLRAAALPLLKLAMMNVRKSDTFKAYWVSKELGSRTTIRYRKPLDL